MTEEAPWMDEVRQTVYATQRRLHTQLVRQEIATRTARATQELLMAGIDPSDVREVAAYRKAKEEASGDN